MKFIKDFALNNILSFQKGGDENEPPVFVHPAFTSQLNATHSSIRISCFLIRSVDPLSGIGFSNRLRNSTKDREEFSVLPFQIS